MAYYNPGFGTYYPTQYPAQQMPQNPAPQTQGSSLIFVQGEGGAKSYLVAPGNSVVLMDSEAAVFYIKSADASGMPTLRTFDYTERKAVTAPPAPAADYVTRAEFDALVARINGKKEAADDGKPDL